MRNTCVAFASTTINDWARHDVFSPEFMAWCAVRLDGGLNESSGATLVAGGQALVRLGQPLDSTWPYQPTTPADRAPLTIFRAARDNRCQKHTIIPEFDLDVLRDEISKPAPVVLGLELYDSFYLADGGNPRLEPPSPTERYRGLHAACIVGETLGSSHPWIIRNSWGPSWGDNGHGYASDGFLRKCVREMLLVEV